MIYQATAIVFQVRTDNLIHLTANMNFYKGKINTSNLENQINSDLCIDLGQFQLTTSLKNIEINKTIDESIFEKGK
jgi:hypothetical protein